jgi:glycosyltransferase involved in cell wall biosynthesis
LKAFPDAPLHTSLFSPETTFPEFSNHDVQTGPLDRIALLRANHRLALPLLPLAFNRTQVDADVLLCSSSGWAHGVRTTGRKVVYCYAPARWLYQPGRYLRTRGRASRLGMNVLRYPLTRWDRRAAATADRYLTSSCAMRDQIRAIYGIDADVIPPPPTLDPAGARHAIDGLSPGFALCVSRLLPYKNVDQVIRAFARPQLRREQLVIVGSGPDRTRLEQDAPPNVVFTGAVSDESLRWLYSQCSCLVSAAYEDYGLTPLEAAAFGKPSVVLRQGGFLDTVVEGQTGGFFDQPRDDVIAPALVAALDHSWAPADLTAHTERFSESRFIAKIRGIVAEA